MFNLRQIISSIADAGKQLFNKKDIKKNDLDSILSLCDDLISNKGAAFGITVARDITELYQTLSTDNKILFSKSEARRAIANKGFKINNVVIDDEKKMLKLKDFRENTLKLSYGKKKHYLVKII